MRRCNGRSRPREVALPAGRLLVPVLATGGGSGASTVVCLMASVFARQGRTLVVDAGPGLASAWPRWLTRPADRPLRLSVSAGLSAQQVYAAAAMVSVGPGVAFSVLTDASREVRVAGAGRLEGCQRLVDVFAPRVAVIDTHTPLLDALGRRQGVDLGADPTGWLLATGVRPVLCAPASAAGVTALLSTVTALEEQGVPTAQLTVAVTGLAARDMPRRVQAGLTLLEPRVGAIIQIPHDPRLRATGHPSLPRCSSRLRAAVDALAAEVARPSAHVLRLNMNQANNSLHRDTGNSRTPTSRGVTHVHTH